MPEPECTIDAVPASDAQPLPPDFHRLQVSLRMTARASLPAHHAGALYSLLATANGRAGDTEPALPEGLMLDAPEQCRLSLSPGERYNFGFTLLSDNPDRTVACLDQLREGLRRHGRDRGHEPHIFGGNFAVAELRDLVASEPLEAGKTPRPIPLDHFEDERRRLEPEASLSLNFTSPLRMPRPTRLREEGHGFFDGRQFFPGLFLLRLCRRLRGLGFLDVPEGTPDDTNHLAHLAMNQLVWLDFSYGPRSQRKSLGGALGLVTFDRVDPAAIRPLVLGQYARCGQNTRFGLGAYRITQLGPPPFPARRAVSLVQLALRPEHLDIAAQRYELPSGLLQTLAASVKDGTYQPEPAHAVTIPKPEGDRRTLRIASPGDRALQRVLFERLAPAIDAFFEDSSFAYRRGLGRQRAAHRIRRAFQEGYGHALKADFFHFFDSIDHRLLRARLSAYVGDEEAVDLIMQWVGAGAPEPERGIPTGSPLSPLLANLFLDEFDEEIERHGGRLVRYADDFLVLYRTRAEADRVYEAAAEAARALALALNEDKTQHIDLTEGFEFLGFRFDRTDRWVTVPGDEPRQLQDLGWHESHNKPRPACNRLVLAGEDATVEPSNRAWAVFGPGAVKLRISSGRLLCAYRDGATSAAHLEHVRAVLVLGRPAVSAGVVAALRHHSVPMVLADDFGRTRSTLTHDEIIENPQAVAAQVNLLDDEAHRLNLAKRLVWAKISNYAALAAALPGQTGQTAEILRAYEPRCHAAADVPELLGIEGAAAAAWYRVFPRLLPEWSHFSRRVAPDASDPANVLLNVAQSALHNQCIAAARLAGLSPVVGVLHTLRQGHAALASDFQEPFRHLMDRVVIEALPLLKPKDFRAAAGGQYQLTIAPKAIRLFLAHLYETFHLNCRSRDTLDTCTYLAHISMNARSYRRHLLDRTVLPHYFRHP